MTDPATSPSVPAGDQLGADYFQDPLGYFARMREQAPVTPVTMPEGGRAWLVTRYAEVRAALADPRLHKEWATKLQPSDSSADPVFGYLSVHLLNRDPPGHTRLRKLVTKAFTARRVAALRPRIEAIASSLLDEMARADEVDLIESFAFPLPITVICELVGVPAADRDRFQAWSHAVVSSVASQEEFRDAAAGMYHYFTGLVAAKRRSPADDLVSALIAARDDEDSLDERELIAMLFLLLIAGHETTTNLIASGTLALLSQPAELARLRASPALLPAAVEELLRYANPLNHATERFTVTEVAIGGVAIPAGEWVLLATSSANGDPDRFPDPERLDVGR
ncbi:MAG TPA: cytochrome P450, partial [Gemmataceae bacterium]|nr:cytochrome P450 [Gemmataceae bacterium]